jgi:hypothetical protein
MMRRGVYIQRGRGFGSALHSVYRSAVPALHTLGSRALNSSVTKNVGKTLAQSAVTGGLEVVADGLSGKNMKDSFSSHVGEAKLDLAKTLRKEAAARKSPAVKRKRSPPARTKVEKPAVKQSRRPKAQSVFDNDVATGSDSD